MVTFVAPCPCIHVYIFFKLWANSENLQYISDCPSNPRNSLPEDFKLTRFDCMSVLNDLGNAQKKNQNAGHHRPATETPWRFVGEPIVARYCVMAGCGTVVKIRI